MNVYIVFENVSNYPQPTQAILREVFRNQYDAEEFLKQNIDDKKWYSGFIAKRELL